MFPAACDIHLLFFFDTFAHVTSSFLILLVAKKKRRSKTLRLDVESPLKCPMSGCISGVSGGSSDSASGSSGRRPCGDAATGAGTPSAENRGGLTGPAHVQDSGTAASWRKVTPIVFDSRFLLSVVETKGKAPRCGGAIEMPHCPAACARVLENIQVPAWYRGGDSLLPEVKPMDEEEPNQKPDAEEEEEDDADDCGAHQDGESREEVVPEGETQPSDEPAAQQASRAAGQRSRTSESLGPDVSLFRAALGVQHRQ